MSDSHHVVDLPSGRIDVLYEPGDRVPVVMIHGNSANKEIFGPQITMLRESGFGVLALDLPGHGRSDNAKQPSDTYSFPGYAEVVRRILDRFGLGQVHVAGWSLGGHIGLDLMGRDPRVQSLLIWGTPPVKPSLDAMREAFLKSAVMGYAGQNVLTAAECATYAAAMAGAPEGPPALIEAIRRTDGQARTWMMANSLKGLGLDAKDLVERDPRPVAVVHGANDPFVNPNYLTRLAYRNLWRGEVQILPGIGHAAHSQSPETFNMLFHSFLLSASEKLSG